MYEYEATVIRVIDGDTFVALVDQGFDDFTKLAFRVYGIDCPEKTGKDKIKGLAAKHRTQELIPPGEVVVIKSFKLPREDGRNWPLETDKYGRWLAKVSRGDMDLASTLILEGHGVSYFGGKRV